MSIVRPSAAIEHRWRGALEVSVKQAPLELFLRTRALEVAHHGDSRHADNLMQATLHLLRDGPAGIAMDRESNRIFAGCGKQSMVVDANAGKVVATIVNGDGVNALGWDASQRLTCIPAGSDGTVTIVHEDSSDKYSVVAAVKAMQGV